MAQKMTNNALVIYGAGGHAKVIADCIISQGLPMKGFIDDNLKRIERTHYSFPVLPGRSSILMEDRLILGIGNNTVRKDLARELSELYIFSQAIIHQSAVISPSVTLGEGTCCMAGVIVNADSVIGRHVILNTGAQVDHDCMIADCVHIAPGAILCGGVKVGEGSLLGVGCTILPGISIGKDCIVGGGTVVINDLIDGCTAIGNLAKITISKITRK